MTAKRSATKTKVTPAAKAGKISAKPKTGSGKKALPSKKGQVLKAVKSLVSVQKKTSTASRKAVAKGKVPSKSQAIQPTSTSSKTAKALVHSNRTAKSAKPAVKKAASQAVAPKVTSQKPALKTVAKVHAKGPVKASKKVIKPVEKSKTTQASIQAPAEIKAQTKAPTSVTNSVPVQPPKTVTFPSVPTPAKVNKASKKKPAKDVRRFTPEELHEFYLAMLDLRRRLSAQVSELREQSLLRHDEVNQDEDGTDAFERVTSLDRASIDQTQINQINNAILTIEEGTYGLCDSCGEKIERPRLKAVPFAKTCIQCQSEMEGDGNRRRPSTDLLD